MAEAAIMLSVIATVALAGVEVARFTLLNQKMERVAASVGDLVAQAETLSETDVSNIMAAIEHVAKPFDISNSGRVIISSIGASNGNPPQIHWQRSGGGSYAATSQFGTPGSGSVSLPAGFAIADGDSTIAAEVIVRYTPWIIPDTIGATEIYHSAFFRPRAGAITQVN
jgi:hypothetical protein